jgi:hypothetical protein
LHSIAEGKECCHAPLASFNVAARGRDIIGRSDPEAQEHKLLNRPTLASRRLIYIRAPQFTICG